MIEVLAISGGKDSAALAMRLNEVEPNPDRVYLHTPTGDELPPMAAHIAMLEDMLGEFVRPHAPTLKEVVKTMRCLPNWRMRFCTRLIKIQPCLAWIRMQSEPVTLIVGLRADEKERKGLYDEDVETRFPLREWGWDIDDVKGYLQNMGIVVPTRTDCARCPYQRTAEWYFLWKDYPEIYADAEEDERWVSEHHGKTCSYKKATPTWPGPLRDLRVEFERGRIPRGGVEQVNMFGDRVLPCRVCRM